MKRRSAIVLFMLLIAVSAAAQQPKLPVPDHIVIVIEENKGFTDIIDSKDAPYLNSLAKDGASLTSFYAFHHPSQPNYLELFSGAEQGVCDDNPEVGPFKARNLGASLIDAGKTFAGYAQCLNPSAACKPGVFVRRHCPWLDFVPLSPSFDFQAFPKDAAGFEKLPRVAIVIPDLDNDMHDVPSAGIPAERKGNPIQIEVRAGDTWLKENLSTYAGWAMTHNSLLVVTWDEDSSHYFLQWLKMKLSGSKYGCPGINTTPPQNQIATILVGQMVKAGSKGTASYNHYDLLRTIEDMYGLTPIGGSASATDITGIWK